MKKNIIILKMIYTFIIWILMLIYIIIRKEIYLNNIITTMDKVVLILFAIFTLSPIFSEVDFMGIKIKREVEKNKIETEKELLEMKKVINNNLLHNSNIINNFVNAPDNALKNMAKDYENIKEEKEIEIDNDTMLCFKVRQRIEMLLKQIAAKYEIIEKNYGAMNILRTLTNKEIITNKLYNILLEIIIICNRAIHGEEISQNHNNFIRSTYKQVLTELERVYNS